MGQVNNGSNPPLSARTYLELLWLSHSVMETQFPKPYPEVS